MSKLVWIPKEGELYWHVFYNRLGTKKFEAIPLYASASITNELVGGFAFKTEREAEAAAKKLTAKLAIMRWMSKQDDFRGDYYIDGSLSPIDTNDPGDGCDALSDQLHWSSLPLLTKGQAEQLIKDLPNELKEYLKK